jgi:hypothetical protein
VSVEVREEERNEERLCLSEEDEAQDLRIGSRLRSKMSCQEEPIRVKRLNMI